MKRDRLNRWPTRAERPELYVHSLTDLAEFLGITPSTLGTTDPSAPHWKVAFDWERGHAYAVEKVPMTVAKGMYDAAFGPSGVVEWLTKRYLLAI